MWVLGVIVAVAAVVGVVLLVWKAPEALYQEDYPGAYSNELAQVQARNARTQAIATTRAALVAGLAGLAALGGLWVNARTLRATLQGQADAREHQQESLRLEREGQLTDRYTKAIDQLGSATLDVRLGGIYALERLMADSPADQPTIVEVLAAYVREHAPTRPQRSTRVRVSPPLPAPAANGTTGPAADVQAALTVLARRVHNPSDRVVDLGRTSLAGARFPRDADLSGATLTTADLTGAHLNEVNLTGVYLNGADLTGARLTTADLTGAGLPGVNLTGARLNRADLTGATLFGVNLSGAGLPGVNLTGARLNRADLTGARLTTANLTGARLFRANLTGAHLNGADLNGAYLDRGALTEAQLGKARGVEAIRWVDKDAPERTSNAQKQA